MNELFIINEEQKSKSSQALFDFLYDNNNYCGLDNRKQITLNNRNIKIFKNEELISTFTSDITIKSDISSGRNVLFVDNSEEIQPLIGKETFWPTKYIITYKDGILIIKDKISKIVIA